MKQGRASKSIKRLVPSACFLLLTIAAFYPVVWMCFSSLKTNVDIYQKPWSLPTQPQWKNLPEAWREGSLGRYLGNSLLVTAISVCLVVGAGSTCGYACARMNFRGRGAVQMLFLVGLILPVQAAVIPLFFLLKKWALLNTLWSLILPYAAWGLPLSIFLFRGFFADIPKAYEEAARIDGCGEFGLYFKIFLPLCKPAIGAVVLFASLAAWNELLMAVLFIEDNELKTLPVGLLAFFGFRQANYSLLFAGLSLVTLPMLALYFVLQKTFMKGLAGGLGELR